MRILAFPGYLGGIFVCYLELFPPEIAHYVLGDALRF
jgi:hypothetical protein